MTSPRLSRPLLTLLVVLFGYLSLPMGMTGTSVALPEIGRDLNASGAALQWVVTGYMLAASSMMLVAGSLGDLFGRRKVYTLGALLYAVGILGSAAAPNVLLLDAARTVAGVGGAAVMAGGGAITATVFEGPARARAFAAVGTTAGVGLALGPTLSGWLVGSLGWRSSFVVFGVAGVLIVFATRLIPESRAAVRPRVDRPGVAAFIASLALLMFAVTQGSQSGWLSAAVLAPLTAGVVLMVAFVRIERRSDHPVLDLTLVRDRSFSAWLVSAVFITAGSVGVLVFLPTYLQGTGGLSAGDTGLIMVMTTAPVFVFPSVGGRLVSLGLAARHLILGALLLTAVGNLWLAFALAPDAGPAVLAGPLLLIGTGSGLALGQLEVQALGAVAPERVGMASGLLGTARGGAGALVMAGFGSLLVTLVQAQTGDRGHAARVTAGQRPERAGEFTAAWQLVVAGVGVTLIASAIVVHRLLRSAAVRSAQPAKEPSPGIGNPSGTAAASESRTGANWQPDPGQPLTEPIQTR
ncbi:MFS transporter [Streptomyces albipurpureus]|uniref:MFS transporter n=1 Tax=Streptomyces albipurpureus TaxID=2897419 RepID=A0ABT0UQB4_9ACTN|nr:MFS transporter [Streptomyces sp. CWNU-1]MCM2390778.1 MFS transporter [Streptomyces sp. CWNU-1]